MTKPLLARRLLHTALLLLVLCGAGHVHNHVCFDGLEPATLVHFENLGGHPDHDEDDTNHADVENELMPQVLLTKTANPDGQLFVIATALVLNELSPSQHPTYEMLDEQFIHYQAPHLLPPAQAPPSHSS